MSSALERGRAQREGSRGVMRVGSSTTATWTPHPMTAGSAGQANGGDAAIMGVLQNETQVIVGIILLVAMLALRGATVNRHIRSKLLISCALFAAYAVTRALAGYAPISPDLAREIGIAD